jgi:hypothetical protein
MSFAFEHLDTITRRLMLDEVDIDLTAGKLYVSDRLSPPGQTNYATLLREAVLLHDEGWLVQQLRSRGCFNQTFQRRKPNGGFTEVHMSSNAPEMLAEGEYNRFYMRGVCRRAINERITQLIVYRAKVVRDPRSESESKIGAMVSPMALLDDLRKNVGIDTALGLPAGPSSGLCVRLGPAASAAA